MKQVYVWFAALALLAIIITSKSFAAELVWEMPLAGPVTIERGPSTTGPFSTVATVPQGITRFLLTPGEWGHYRVRNTAGSSNTAQYALDVYSDTITTRLATLETRVSVLEQPPMVTTPPTPSNISFRQLDANRVELTCVNSTSMRSSGSGLRRVVECIP